MKKTGKNSMAPIVVAGIAIVALILIVGTIWMGQSAKKSTETAVHAVSLLYLNELAGRREQVVESTLQDKSEVIRVAVSLMSEEDLRDAEHLQAYQARMKRLFRLDKFAFVDRNGLIYTSQGTQTNIGDYRFDYKTLNQPEISVLNPKSKDKKAIIAVPIAPLAFNGEELTVCFMEIDMAEMLSGVSMELQNTDATFCKNAKRGDPMLTIDALNRFGADTKDGMSRCLNNEAMYLRLVVKALENDNYDRLSSAVAAGDRKAAFEAAHAIKGMMGNLGLTMSSPRR